MDSVIIDECDYLTHISALIYYHTGQDPDEMDEEQFIKAAARIEYSMRKLRPKI